MLSYGKLALTAFLDSKVHVAKVGPTWVLSTIIWKWMTSFFELFNLQTIQNENVDLMSREFKNLFFFLHKIQVITLVSQKVLHLSFFHQFKLSQMAFCINSSQLYIFHKWQKWGNVNSNIGINCSQNARPLTCYHATHVKTLLSSLFCINIFMHFCNQKVNIFFCGTL